MEPKVLVDGDMDGFVDTDYNPYGSNNSARQDWGAIETPLLTMQSSKLSLSIRIWEQFLRLMPRDYLASIENGENKGNVPNTEEYSESMEWR